MLDLNLLQLQTDFDQHAFKCKHLLLNHPLLQSFELRQLAENLSSYEFQSGKVPVDLPNAHLIPKSDKTLLETFDSLEKASAWIALKNIEQNLKYKNLLEEIIQKIKSFGASEIQDASQYEAFIFISSSHAITPYHMDPEHNFLLQIRGRKKVYVLDKSEKSLVPEIEIESFYQTGHRNRKMPAAALTTAKLFELEPGDALYIPPTAPHWVEVLPGEVSISLSATFRTPATKQRERNYRANAFLRSIGWNPSTVGKSTVLDHFKYLAWVFLRNFMSGRSL